MDYIYKEKEKQMLKIIILLSMQSFLIGTMLEANELEQMYIYDVEINVKSTKENGETWDVAGGAPDLLLKVDGKSLIMRNSCWNTYRCTVSFVSEKSRWYFENDDRDMVSNDLIGKGVCSIGKVCNLGRSTIKIKRRKNNG